MRSGFIVAGLLIAVIGIAFWYFPLQSVATGAIAVNDGAEHTVGGGAPYSVLNHQVPYTLKWSSTTNVTVKIYDCGTDSTCALASTGPLVGSGAGSSGTVAWSGENAHYYAILPSGGSVTVAVSYLEPIAGGYAGVGGVVVGVALILAGILIRTPPMKEETVIREPYVPGMVVDTTKKSEETP